jgi:protein-tyrosine phosphatase
MMFLTASLQSVSCMSPDDVNSDPKKVMAQIRDVEDENISQYFEDGSSYIDSVEEKGGTILVHCFEGKSRSAAVVLAYLMLRK